MAGIWYRTGTISAENGSADVTGVGTLWLDPKVGAQPGNIIFMPDGNLYEVAYVLSNTLIRLAGPYQGQTVTGASYAIVTPIVGSIPALATKVASTLAFVQGQYEVLDAWANGGVDEDVTVTNPNNGETTVIPSLAKLSKMTESVGDAVPAAERSVAAAAEAKGYKDAAAGSAQQAAASAATVAADADRAENAANAAAAVKTSVDASAAQAAASASAASESATIAAQKAADAVATEARISAAASTQITAIEEKGSSEVARVAAEGATQIAAVGDKGSSEVTKVAAEGAAQITLATAQASASEASAVRSEAAAQRAEDLVDQATGGSLLKEQNLADVPDKAVARSNLGAASQAALSDVSSSLSALESRHDDDVTALHHEDVRLDGNIESLSKSVLEISPATSGKFNYEADVLVGMRETLQHGAQRDTQFNYDSDGRLTSSVAHIENRVITTTYNYVDGLLVSYQVAEEIA